MRTVGLFPVRSHRLSPRATCASAAFLCLASLGACGTDTPTGASKVTAGDSPASVKYVCGVMFFALRGDAPDPMVGWGAVRLAATANLKKNTPLRDAVDAMTGHVLSQTAKATPAQTALVREKCSDAGAPLPSTGDR